MVVVISSLLETTQFGICSAGERGCGLYCCREVTLISPTCQVIRFREGMVGQSSSKTLESPWERVNYCLPVNITFLFLKQHGKLSRKLYVLGLLLEVSKLSLGLLSLPFVSFYQAQPSWRSSYWSQPSVGAPSDPVVEIFLNAQLFWKIVWSSNSLYIHSKPKLPW